MRDVDHVGRTINVSNVARAAETLMTWQARGPRWRTAVQTCMDAMDGKTTAKDVRRAFTASAKEAGIEGWLLTHAMEPDCKSVVVQVPARAYSAATR